ncbi:MAG: SH3 domain-containing protein [Cyanothece sp. SIO2G6]|nr:SH3 domain-containing protein [Cyanothece sp. SIO2G6]
MMEILAFTYLAVDYEAPVTNKLHCRIRIPSLPSSAWITVTALTLALSSLASVPAAIALVRQGDMGEDVSELQTSLQNLGYSVGSIDGIFGNGTKNALMRFQQQHGLTVDGIAGTRTFAKLAELENSKPTENGAVGENPGAGTGGNGAVLTLGDSGTAIATLQTRLRDLGFFPANVTISGYYGPITVDAVEAFQRSQNLAVDGIAGPVTQTALAAAQPRSTETPTTTTPAATPAASAPTAAAAPTVTPTVTPTAGTLRQGDSGDAVTALQASLQQLNYFSLPPTGYYGPVTTASVEAFQQANGLTVDGIAGPRTLAKLAEVSTTTSEGSVTQPSAENDEVERVRVTENPPSLNESGTSDPATNNPTTSTPDAVQAVSDPVEETATTPTTGSVVTVQATNGLRIRTAPSTQAAIAGLLLNGTSVQVTGEQVGNWLEINPSGWIHQDYVIR